MTDNTDIREQLAAFLADELDGPAAEALQARIDAEPWVGRLADEVAEVLVSLSSVDEVQPPAGYGDRLRAGLEAELGRPLAPPAPDQRLLTASGAAAATGWSTDARPAGRGDASRPDRQRAAGARSAGRRSERLRRSLGVAAALVVLAVAGTSVLTQLRPMSGDDTADSADDVAAEVDERRLSDDAEVTEEADPFAAQAPAAESAGDATAFSDATESDDAADEDAAVDDDGAGEARDAEDDVGTATTAAGPVQRPVVLTLGSIEDDDSIRRAVGGHPAAQGLLGLPAADARERAGAYRDELLRGPDFDDGTAAAACLSATLAAAGDDLVPAVAARLDLAGSEAVAYALVRSRTAEVLDTVDIWVLDLPGCEVDRILQG
ncbi:hypothetical protein BH23ACT9_BH23ACT9_25170 [soil metagenome]